MEINLMKKSLLALAVLGAFAGAAQAADSNVTIYGALDIGLTKSTGSTLAENNGDNNKLGFKGSEDLGNGLSAIFQAEIRFDSDTGKTEGGGTRPLFQGRSTVGFQGGFGKIRLGRDLTAKQNSAGDFDPWGATRNRGAMNPEVMDGGYISDPLNPTNGSQNRFSNGLIYNSPVMGGFQANLSLATKESLDAGTPTDTPYSLSATYNNGPIGAFVAAERNALNGKIWQLGGSYAGLGPAKLMATYGRTDLTSTGGTKVKAWTIGAVVTAGPGNVLAGFGQQKPDVGNKKKKFALGYEYNLSKRTFLYTDYTNVKVDGSDAVNTYDVGVHHSF
jgi:predicted porin